MPAQPLPPFLVQNFGGGINLSTAAQNIADNEVEEALNKDLNLDGSLTSRKGAQQYNSTLTGGSRVTSLYYTKKTDGSTSMFIATTLAKIYKDDGVGGWTEITGSTTPPSNTLWKWVTFNNLAIGVNGTSVPQKNSFSGNCADLGGSPPDKCKLIEVFRGRVLLAGDTDEPTALHGCAAGNAEDWTTAADAFKIYIDKDNGQPITAIVKFFEVLIIFKRKGVYRLENPTNTPANFQVLQVFDDIGCVSPYSVMQIGNELVFADDDGVYALRATEQSGDVAYTAVSKKIQPLVDDTAYSYMNECYATDLRIKNQYRLSVPKAVATQNNHVLVRDYLHGAWLRHEGIAYACYSNPSEISSKREILAGGYDGKVYKINRLEADAGAAFIKLVRTKRYSMGVEMFRKWFHRVYMEYAVSGSYSIGFSALIDEVISKGLTLSSSSSLPLWDVALWDVANWAGSGTERRWMSIGKKGRSIQFQYLNSNASEPFSLYKLSVLSSLLGRRG